jgi:hypothetical protein
MASSKKSRLLGSDPWMMPSMTPGALGINEAASPDTPDWFVGYTPGSLGINDHAATTALPATF